MSKDREFIDAVEKLAQEYGINTMMLGFSIDGRVSTSGMIKRGEVADTVLHNQILNIYASIIGKFNSDYAEEPDIIKKVNMAAESVKKDYQKWANLQVKKALH